MENDDENAFSYIVVSNDDFSKKIKVYKNTNFDQFYQNLLDNFPRAFNYFKKLFYYEAYSHEKMIITNEDEFIKANNKCIEFFYFCPNYSDYCLQHDDEENTDYLKYHSVLIFTPIKIVNTEEQKNQKKKMKIKIENNNNNNNIINNYNNNVNHCQNNNNMYNNMMMSNNMGMNNGMNNNMMNNNMMNNNMIMNNYMMMSNNRMMMNNNIMNNGYNTNNQMFNNYNMNNMNNQIMMNNYNNMNNQNNMNMMNSRIITPMIYNNNYTGNMNYNYQNNNMRNQMMMNNSISPMMNNNMSPMMNNHYISPMQNNYNNMNPMMKSCQFPMNSMNIQNNAMNNNINNPMIRSAQNQNQMMMSTNMMNNNNNMMNNNLYNNNMMNNNNLIMNNNMMPNNIMTNNMMNNNMMINRVNYCQPMNTNINQQTFKLFMSNLQNNRYKALLMMRQMNQMALNNQLKLILQKANSFKKVNNQKNNNDINPNLIQEYEILDTETNPMNKYIENAINISFTMKQQILDQKSKTPDIFIDMANTLSTPGLLTDTQPKDEDYKYILCLIGKILENNGITVGIYKDSNIIIKDRIDLATIQFIFSGLISKKKYKIIFNFDENEILCIKHSDYKKELYNKWKDFIAEKLNVSKKLIILTNLREEKTNEYCMDLAFNPEATTVNKDEKNIKEKLQNTQIKDIKMIPLIEGCRLSSNIFEPNFNKLYVKNNNNNNNNNINIGEQNQKRGNEDYIPPYDWAAYGINIAGKYDFGDNTWLGNTNQDGEYAVAYYGINNISHQNIQMIQNIISFMGNLESGKTFMNEVNLRNKNEKCMTGAYFYKNPEIAENSSEIINIGGFDYKIMFMCRVNSKKIRQPENFPELWILSPTPDDIRPYKILIKKIAKSSLANASQLNIKMSMSHPPESYYKILQQKDESHFSHNTGGINNLDFVLKEYTGSMYSYVNNYLRDGTCSNGNLTDVNSTVWCLHKAITQNNCNVQNGALLYRGVCKKLPSNIGIGTSFYFPEFISTSKDINVARSFGGKGTLMYITVKDNGTNGKKIYCRDVSSISNYPSEQEIIFTSYCRFRVTKIERSDGWDILHLICEGHDFK